MDNKIKIKFEDLEKTYNTRDNIFVRILEKYFGGYEFSDKPDFLIYSCFGINHLKYDNCVKIFFSDEAVTPDFNQCDYAISFDWMQFENRYIRRPVWNDEERFYEDFLISKGIEKKLDMANLVETKEKTSVIRMTDEEALDRKFCNFIYYNNSQGEGTDFRKKFVAELSKYKPVDCPGKVMNNMSAPRLIGRFDGDWRKSKIDFIKNYKFTIAFENCSFRGYTTEKIIHPYVASSVPIYWGNPAIEKDFDKNSFISCNDYYFDEKTREVGFGIKDNINSITRIVERIVELDENPDKYLEMLRSKPLSSDFDYEEISKYQQFIYNIFKKGNFPYNKDPLRWNKRMSVDNLSRKEKIKYFLLKK